MIYNNKYFFCLWRVAVGWVACVAAVSCDSKPKAVSSEDSSSIVSFEPFAADEWYAAESPEGWFSSVKTVVMRDSVSLMLPVKGAIRDSVIKTAFDTVCPPLEAAHSLFLKAATESDFPFKKVDSRPNLPDSLTAPAVVTITGSVVALTPRFISYVVISQTYTAPAAHGYTAYEYVVAELPSGKVLKLDDLLTPAGIDALPALARQSAEINNLTIDNCPGPLPLPYNNNFFISPDGVLTLAYNAYEIGSYAQGLIKIPIWNWNYEQYLTPLGRFLLE